MAFDILLATINAKWIHPSLALRLLKANLGALKDRCLILEFALRQKEQEKIEAIINASPRIMGLSVSIWNHKATLDLLKALHEKWRRSPRPWVILGGPEVSWLPENAEIFRYADYVIQGEGEDAFRELCESLLEKGSENTPVPDARFIQGRLPDLSSLASPYHLYTDDDLSQRLIYVESSRGCAFNCDFCLSALDKGKVREFPLEAFLGDMEKLLKRLSAQEHTIKFLDRSFNLNPGRAVKIAKFFLDRVNGKDKNLCVHFEIVPINVTPELSDAFSRFPAGSLRLELGIQTLNPVTASTINRIGKTEDALEVLTFLCEKTNAIIHVDLIAGLPGEDIASFGRGFDRLWLAMTSSKSMAYGAAKGLAMEIQLGILKLLPGTPLERHTDSYGMRYAAEPPYEVIETSAIPLKEMDRIKNFARFWELLVNRNHFKNQIGRHVPVGVPVFWQFMELSDRLLQRFGRNWGIDREELRKALAEI
ncbi:MAG: DUF4080 domain-containing protein [Treponema sp.]|jgi:radical SAM superfamily enzyme YgiQ (UPF0313 family)|nr:DUF4080 domain-containing protein [Treponema sp.]